MNFTNILKFETHKSSGAEYKSCLLKKDILAHFARFDEATIADLAHELNVSVPTVTKLVTELREDGYLMDYGKIETAGGRRPNIFGLSAEVNYFVGMDIMRHGINFVLINFKGEVKHEHTIPDFKLQNNPETLAYVLDTLDSYINSLEVKREAILGIGVSMTGRIDSAKGHSYTYFNFDDKPLYEVFRDRFNIPIHLENDSRAMVYAEKCFGVVKDEHNVLMLNIGRGVGIGMLLEDRLYYGKSGFAGEFGHIPLFDNEMMCHCGKKGCIETEASGVALESLFNNRISQGESSLLSVKHHKGESVMLRDIISAANNDDVLSITLISELAEKMGRGIGVLINLFNPELVVVGGVLSQVGDYLMLPLKTAINKYSLSLVSKDTTFKLSKLGDSSSCIGAAMLVRAQILNIN
ncbi:MAG: ROK family protein [Marinifilaceae bacterium]